MKNLQKILTVFLLIITLTAFASCESKVTNLEVGNFDTTVIVGEEVNLEGATITVTHKNKKTETITVEDVTVSQIDTTTVGEKDLTFTYKDVSVTVKVNVIGVKDINVTGVTEKVLKDEPADLSGVRATVTFDDDTTREVAGSELTLTAVDTTSTGDKVINITYKNKTIQKIVKVVDIQSVRIDANLEVEKGTVLTLPQRDVIVTYTDGEIVRIALNKIATNVNNFDTTTAGQKDLTITYMGRTFTQTVTVYEVEKAEMLGTIPSLKIDSDGLVVYNYVTGFRVTYTNGKVEEITLADLESYDTNVDLSSAGEKVVDFMYKGFEFSAKVNVIGIKSIALNNMPNKVIKGETVDLSKVILTITYDDNSTTNVDYPKVTYSNIDTSVVGGAEFTVTYKNKTETKSINVIDITNVQIDYNLEVEKGETFVLPERVVIVTYSDNTTSTINIKDITTNAADLNTQVNDDVTSIDLVISYKGRTFTQSVSVYKANKLEISSGYIPAVKFGGVGTVDYSNVKSLTVTYTNGILKTITVDDLDAKTLTVDATESGEKQIELTYKGYTEVLTVEVSEKPSAFIKVNEDSYQQKVKLGGEFTLDNLTAIISYDDTDDENLVTVNDIVVDGTVNTAVAGKYTITLTYQKENYNSAVTRIVVEVLSVKKIEIDGEHVQKIRIGEDYDLTLIKTVKVTYSDDIMTEVLDVKDVNITNIDTNEAGIKYIVISYNGYTDTTSNAVEVIGVKDIVINGEYDTMQMINHDYDYTKIESLTIIYDTDTTDFDQTIDFVNEYIIAFVDTTSYGDKYFTIKYYNKEINVDVKVLDIEKIELNDTQYDKKVMLNHEYDISRIDEIIVTYSDGVNTLTETVNIDSTYITNIETNVSGTAFLVVTYNKFAQNIEIKVLAVTNIVAIGNNPDTYIDEEFVPDVYSLTVTYGDNELEEVVKSGYVIEDYTFIPGTVVIPVTYNGFTTNNLTVNVIGFKGLKYSGEVPERVLIDTELDLSGITGAVLTYNDDTTKVIALDKLTIVNEGTATIGYHNVRVSYRTVEDVITYLVVTEDYIAFEHDLLKFDIPETIESYNDNSQNTDGEASFSIAGKDYLVGSDNAFKLMPGILVADTDEEITEIPTTITLQVSTDGEEFVDADLADYTDSVGRYNVNIDFNENAVGKYFIMTVAFANNFELDEDFHFTHTFKVIKGYNIHNAKEFAVIDNSKAEWNSIKEENNLTGVTCDTIILHDNIKITDEDLPASYFWTAEEVADAGLNAEIVGSLKEPSNSTFLYIRSVNEGESFTIYGNYFDVDASGVSLVRYNKGDGMTTVGEDGHGGHAITCHTALLDFRGPNNATNTNVIMRDIGFRGNTKRSDSGLDSGGLMIFKATDVCMDIDNTCYQGWYIGYMFESATNYITIDGTKYILSDYSDEYYTFVKDGVTYYVNKTDELVYSDNTLQNGSFEEAEIVVARIFNEINNTKGFECYNSHFYIWGGQVNIRNSAMKSAGGPVMIVDHVGNNGYNETTGTGGRPSYVYIYNSDLQSYVTGSEPWFVTYGATTITEGISSASEYYNIKNRVIGEIQNNLDYVDAQTRAYLEMQIANMTTGLMTEINDTDGTKKDMMNLIVVYKSGEAEGLTGYKVRGEVKFIDQNNSLLLSGKNSDRAMEYGGMGFVLENSQNGLSLDTTNTDNSEIYDPNTYVSFSTMAGDPTYVNIYITNGMGAVVQLFKK